MAKTSKNIASALLLLVLLSVASHASSRKLHSIITTDGLNDAICKSMVQIYGYICEEHTVTTEDGYILSIQRIPAARSGKSATKPPVLLQHGLLIDAGSWLLNSPDESLGFMLADNGYDVWLANTRGTNQSLGHTTLSPNDQAYWEWSWDELMKYDLAAFVQHVYDKTGQKLHYVGHSLGTTVALAALSREEMLNMLRSAALLSPIAYLNQIPYGPARAAADMYLAEEMYVLGLHEFVPGGEEVAKFLETICNMPGINCSNLMEAFTGPNCCVNSSKANSFFKHEPQPTSTKNMIHLAQMIRKEAITMYDYGNEDGNMNHYGQPTPPVYNMTSIPRDFPLFLGYGGKDMLAGVKDVQTLLHSLKDHDGDKLVVQYIENYAHADFILGVNANQVIYDPIMAFLRLQN